MVFGKARRFVARPEVTELKTAKRRALAKVAANTILASDAAKPVPSLVPIDIAAR
jgi:hypothetical protein